MSQEIGDRVVAIAPQSTTALVPHRVVVVEQINTRRYYDAFRAARREVRALERALADERRERATDASRLRRWRVDSRRTGLRIRRAELAAASGWGAALLLAGLWVASLLGLG